MKINLFITGLLAVGVGSSALLQAQVSPSSGNKDAESQGDIGKTSSFGTMMNKQTGSMHFYGKVANAAGKLPWDAIPVVVTCGGQTKFNTVADPKGGFDIAPPARISEVASKKDPAHAGPSELVGCTVSATVEGFKSSTITIANRSLEDDPSIGTIVLHPDEHALSSIASATTTAAPPDAMKEFDKARADDLDKHPDGAKKHLQKAVSIDANFAEAWYHLGKLEETDKPADALTAYQKAAAADPAYILPYERIAALSAIQKKWPDVVDATNKALKLNPTGTPQIWYFDAVGSLNSGDAAKAEKSAETSLAMDPSHLAPNTEQLLAVIQANRGDYSDALNHLRHCLTYMPAGPNADLIKQQVAQLEKATGQASK
jgi:hypothetical protein